VETTNSEENCHDKLKRAICMNRHECSINLSRDDYNNSHEKAHAFLPNCVDGDLKDRCDKLVNKVY
jgi:hypothetical protein